MTRCKKTLALNHVAFNLGDSITCKNTVSYRLMPEVGLTEILVPSGWDPVSKLDSTKRVLPIAVMC